jgi:hypothetical protein
MKVNLREGMRRLSILLGVCGGIVGASLAYGELRATWDAHEAFAKFESTMASATMQKVAKATSKIQNDEWVKYQQPTDHGKSDTIPKQNQIRSDPWQEAANEYSRKEPSGFTANVNAGGIRQVTSDARGLITSICLSSGETIQRVEAPSTKAYLIPFLYPVFGFLIPWAAVQLLAWVGGGFASQPKL